MPALQPVDESFFTTAPTRYSRTWSIARPASEVWAELTGDKPLHWCSGLDITWTSARPFAVGTTRKAKVLGGVLSVQEHFFIWDEGRRNAFYVTKANAPLFKRLAEDYVVAPDGDSRCSFTWTIAIEPTTLGKPGKPVNDLLFKRFFDQTGKYFNA